MHSICCNYQDFAYNTGLVAMVWPVLQWPYLILRGKKWRRSNFNLHEQVLPLQGLGAPLDIQSMISLLQTLLSLSAAKAA